MFGLLFRLFLLSLIVLIIWGFFRGGYDRITAHYVWMLP